MILIWHCLCGKSGTSVLFMINESRHGALCKPARGQSRSDMQAQKSLLLTLSDGGFRVELESVKFELW
jgi:hypothetical protein